MTQGFDRLFALALCKVAFTLGGCCSHFELPLLGKLLLLLLLQTLKRLQMRVTQFNFYSLTLVDLGSSRGFYLCKLVLQVDDIGRLILQCHDGGIAIAQSIQMLSPFATGLVALLLDGEQSRLQRPALCTMILPLMLKKLDSDMAFTRGIRGLRCFR